MSDGTLDPELGLALFTDGSANYRDRTGGYGWVALDAFDGLLTGSGYLHPTTISQMELTAAIKGLQKLCELYGASDVLVYSDSEYVVLGATNRERNRKKNIRLWKALDKAVSNHTYVEFKHVKGHNDDLYNEMADDLAGTARKEGISDAPV